MIRFFKKIFLVICLAGGLTASAQTTTSSPYSQYGLGNLKGLFLPQNRAMAGIAVGLRNLGPIYNNINPANPASYSAITLTTFDIGASSGISQISKSGISKNSFNGTLSHLLFAVPVNKISALSFGILPYSDLGYKFKVSSGIDTNVIDHVYGGDGGLAKAYLGYGIMAGKHFSLGFNAGYLFGKLSSTRSVEFPEDQDALNSRTQKNNSIGGLGFDYGVQYFTNITSTTRLILGYSGNGGNKINSVTTEVTTHYRKFEGDETAALDTVFLTENEKVKITMPMTHTLGFSLQGTSKWMVGADFSMSNWADYREGSSNPNLHNSYSFAAGGQVTPNINAVSSYFKYVDYRIGFKYDKTYININNTDIRQTALTFGFGFPLPSTRGTLYKINFAAELGQRGKLDNNLVRERFVNFHLGFLLNDRWFIRNKID